MTLNGQNVTVTEINKSNFRSLNSFRIKSAQSIVAVGLSVNKIRVDRAHRAVIFAVARHLVVLAHRTIIYKYFILLQYFLDVFKNNLKNVRIVTVLC